MRHRYLLTSSQSVNVWYTCLMKTYPVLVLGIIAIIIVSLLAITSEIARGPHTQAQACTTEDRICPDGTAVGRTGPNCEFAACPEPVEGLAPTSTSNAVESNDARQTAIGKALTIG